MGDRRQETGDGRQKRGDGKQKTGDRRWERVIKPTFFKSWSRSQSKTDWLRNTDDVYPKNLALIV